MSDNPVEGAIASIGETRPRVGLRQAFGLSGAARVLPTLEGDALARGLMGGATRALLGREATGLELAMAQRGFDAEAETIEAFVKRLIGDLLSQPEAAKALAATEAGTQLQAAGAAAAAPAHARLSDEAVFAGVANGVFLGLLGREAGPDGLRVFRESMFDEYQNSDLAAFIWRFIVMVVRSPEWLHRAISEQARAVRSEYLPKQGVEGTGHVSLGASGFTSGMFKRFGLKRWSGPFDWLSASPAMIREIMADDFRRFLNPDAWEAIAAEDRPDGRYFLCRHSYYQARHQEACILHAADMTQDSGLAYMERCVTRFRQSLQGLPNKIVLQVATEGDDPLREFRATADLLNDYGRSFQFVMVSVLPDHGAGPFPEVDPAMQHGPHRLLRARLLAPIIGIEASDPMDEMVLLRAALAAPSLGS